MRTAGSRAFRPHLHLVCRLPKGYNGSRHPTEVEPVPAAIFDMDGVLVDSNAAHFRAWQSFGKRYGIEIDEAIFAKYINGRRNDEFLEEMYPGRWSAEERLRISDEKEAYYREHYVPEVPPVPGVVDFIKSLKRRGVPLALATSAVRENADLILSLLGIESAFSAKVTGLEVPAAKPNPAIFVEAARRLGVPAEQCVVFEDSPAGVEAAVRAGARCVAIATTVAPQILLGRGAHRVLDHFEGVDAGELFSSLGLG